MLFYTLVHHYNLKRKKSLPTRMCNLLFSNFIKHERCRDYFYRYAKPMHIKKLFFQDIHIWLAWKIYRPVPYTSTALTPTFTAWTNTTTQVNKFLETKFLRRYIAFTRCRDELFLGCGLLHYILLLLVNVFGLNFSDLF